MLLVGSTNHLEDLDREYTIAEDTSVTAIAAGQMPGGAVYVLLDGERVARVGDFELTEVSELPSATGQSMAAAGAKLIVGTEGAHLLEVDPGTGQVTALESFDRVPGREAWGNPAASEPDLCSIAVGGDGSLFVNVHVGGLWRSTDAGATWQNVIEPALDVHEVATGAGGRVVVAAARGAAWSDDSGRTWKWTAEGMHAGYARAVAVDDDVAYVTSSTGPTSTDGRIYRWRAGGALEQCRTGLPDSFPYNLDSGCVAARSGEVVLGTRDGRLYRSRDGGESWEQVAERMHAITSVRFG